MAKLVKIEYCDNCPRIIHMSKQASLCAKERRALPVRRFVMDGLFLISIPLWCSLEDA